MENSAEWNKTILIKERLRNKAFLRSHQMIAGMENGWEGIL